MPLPQFLQNLEEPDFSVARPRRQRNTVLRIGIQAGTFAMLMAMSYSVGVYKGSLTVQQEHLGRHLSTSEVPPGFRQLVAQADADLLTCNSTDVVAFPPPPKSFSDSMGYIALLIFGLVYMFWALAIVVDEFFVPALDVIADKMGISHDVAGATLMAAGGSAPEFFTSLFSAVQEPSSATGFGTIVGSAVFNVLFVIAACAMFSKETLHLTWWPLFRDVTYYAISLTVLTIFFIMGGDSWFYTESEKIGLCEVDIEVYGSESECCYQVADDESNQFLVTGESTITWVEALILFLMYIGYVVLMKYQRDLYWVVMKKFGGSKYGKKKYREEIEAMNALFTRPSTFRAGILQMVTSDDAISNQAGVGVVTKIKGNVHDTFLEVDKDRNGCIDNTEMGLLLEYLGVPATEENIATAIQAVDTDGNGTISEEEFTQWYLASEARLIAEMDKAFDRFDSDKNGTIDKLEFEKILRDLGNHPEPTDISEALDVIDKDDDGLVSKDEFISWYKESMFWKDAREKQEAEAEEAPLAIWPPPRSARAILFYTLSAPLTFPMFFTIPNPKRERFNSLGWATMAFFMSIIWIGFFAWVMVWCAESFGMTLGIPNAVMGVTILAAGTSIPDLLSSIIVARQGHGDMAVSSSIGSNIFDILVGLPIPWLISIGVKGRPVLVGASNIGTSIAVLLGMLVAVIVIIMLSGWKLSRFLAACMMFLYGLFILQDLLQADWDGSAKASAPKIVCAGCSAEMICMDR